MTLSFDQSIKVRENIFKPIMGGSDANTKNITFIVTQNCQLRCKYCYLIGKNNDGKMDFSVAQKTIDYLLSSRDVINNSSVIIEFMGGEPFLEIDLIDRICEYFKRNAYELNHPWFEGYRFLFSTNGLMYSDTRVQRFIQNNINHVSIGITIDGTKTKHDLHRVYPNGMGSYDNVVKNIPLWLEQFHKVHSKVTISHDDLPYIKESVLHLWELGIDGININVVFEDVWQKGDDELFERQLIELADEIIDKGFYNSGRYCSFFSRAIGKPLKDNQNWCGAGKMLAVDSEGNFYPCIRFVKFSLKNKNPRSIGNCYDGIDSNKLRPFLTLTATSQSNLECINCEVATGCAWCQGANYDCADTNTIYQRATFICAMHKARVRANNYFWKKLDKKLDGLYE